MQADICVVVPAHSWPQHFPEAMASIQAQTVQPRKVLVVYDGVKPYKFDTTFELHTRVLRKNRGVAIALNQAMVQADNEWVFRLDEDDKLHPQCFEKLLLSAKLCPDRDIHYSDWVKFGAWCGYMAVPDYSYERLLRGPFITSACLMRTAVWEQVREVNGWGWDPKMKGWEDYLFFLESGALGVKMARVGLGLVRYRGHPSSVSDTAHAFLPQNVAYMRKKLMDLYGVTLTYEIPTRLAI